MHLNLASGIEFTIPEWKHPIPAQASKNDVNGYSSMYQRCCHTPIPLRFILGLNGVKLLSISLLTIGNISEHA